MAPKPKGARQPANTPHEAIQRYAEYLQQPLSCISKAVWSYGPPVNAVGDEQVLILPKDEPILLRTADSKVWLHAAQRFVVVEDTRYPGEWKTSTREYIYKVSEDPDAEAAVEWHWHPARKRNEPHLHSRFAPGTEGLGRTAEGLHLPTGRVAFEDVVKFLITDVGVPTTRPDAEQLIDESLAAFVRFRLWPSPAAAVGPEASSAELDDGLRRPKKTRAERPRKR